MSENRKIYVVDDDAKVRESMRVLLESAGYLVHDYASATHFLAEGVRKAGCLIADIRMPDMGGLEMQQEIVRLGIELPVIFITGHGDVSLAVGAMRAGAIDFIEKPFDVERILICVENALKAGERSHDRAVEMRAATELLSLLTPRERAVLNSLVKGFSNKVAAHDLGISPRTIEIHRSRIKIKLKARDLSDLVRVSLIADARRP
jgi:two-component system response regulator FixJ